MGGRKMDGTCVPELAWHPGELRIYGPSITRGGGHLHSFHPEFPWSVIAPFLLNVSDEHVLGGKQAHKREQLLHGFIVYSLLGPRLDSRAIELYENRAWACSLQDVPLQPCVWALLLPLCAMSSLLV